MTDPGQTTKWPWQAVVGIWLVFAAAMLMANFNRVAGLDLGDTDDYMRLVQVERWLDGGAWNDLTEPRLNPPEGTTLHWSRLPDLPIAGVMAVAGLWTDRQGAAATALMVVPTAYLLAFLLLVAWLSARTFGPGTAPLAALLAAFAVPATGQFMPGRIDHHGLQILLSMVMLAGAMRVAAGTRGLWPVATGLAIALALAIGIEALPQIAAAYGALALGWVLGRREMLQAAVVTALTAAAATAAILLLAVPRGPYFIGACDSLSLAYGTAIALVAAAMLVLWLLDRWLTSAVVRVVAGAVAVALVGIAFVIAFPDCAAGPYAALPAQAKEVWLQHVEEARSALTLLGSDVFGFVLYFMLPAIAIAVAVKGLVKHPEQPHWLPLLVFLGVTTLVALIQVRAATVTNAVAIIGALPFYRAIYAWVTQRLRVLPHLAGIVAMLMVSPAVIYGIGSTALPSAAQGKKVNACDIAELSSLLGLPGAGPVMAPSNLGPAILAHTDQAVIGAPYHRNVGGIVDSIDFFMTPDDAHAQTLLQAHQASLVAFCSTGGPYSIGGIKDPQSIAYRLTHGDYPVWLELAGEDGGWRILRVRP